MIKKTFSLYCAECSAMKTLPARRTMREILYSESMGGGRVDVVRACPHIVSLETFDIENERFEEEVQIKILDAVQ